MFTPAETAACQRLIELAFREDLGDAPSPALRDPTTFLYVPPGQDGSAAFVARQPGVLAGLPAIQRVCETFDPSLRFETTRQDGQPLQPGDMLARLHGPMASILAVERTALNFVQYLSGIASATARYVQAVADLPAKILDTRKTLAGWRLLAKYAVRQGGGHNHRLGLYDGILIKDNHIAFAAQQQKGNVTAFVARVRQEAAQLSNRLFVQVEVDTLAQLDEVLPARPDMVLLDNMSLEQLKAAVRQRDNLAPGVLLEASGGVTLQTVRGIAETGVDRISVGALTHSVTALDIGLDFEAWEPRTK